MKKMILTIPALLIGICLLAQPPKGPADKGMTFGEKTTADGAVSANELAAKLKGTEAAEVKVTGKVVEMQINQCRIQIKGKTPRQFMR